MNRSAAIDQICDRFEEQLIRGQNPKVGDYVQQAPSELRDELALELTAVAAEYRRPSELCEIPERFLDHSRRYLFIRELGQGAYGRVFHASDRFLDRHVAIKVPSQPFAAKTRTLDMFLKEAKLVAQLDHPGIVSVYDFGLDDEREPYVVYQFVPGESLDKIRSRLYSDRERGIAIVAMAAHALSHAHSHGVIHRDIKPSNIIVRQDGMPVVIDFGAAFDEVDFGVVHRATGSACYMSPEQVGGLSHTADRRSDIFSLGVLLYELLTGRMPDAQRSDHAVADLPKPSECDSSIPRELDRVCLTCLERSPQNRYQTADELAFDLVSLLEPSSTVAGSSDATRSQRVFSRVCDTMESGSTPLFFSELLARETKAKCVADRALGDLAQDSISLLGEAEVTLEYQSEDDQPNWGCSSIDIGLNIERPK